MLIILLVISRTPTSRKIEGQQAVAFAKTTPAAAVSTSLSLSSCTLQGLKLLIIIDGKIILSQEVSVKNPPPICVEVPVLRRLASFCIDFYNITWHGHVGGCLKLEIKLLYIIEQTYYIGCFHFNNLDAESKAGVSAILRDLHRLQQNRENLATQI
eukprot:gene16737-8194_t